MAFVIRKPTIELNVALKKFNTFEGSAVRFAEAKIKEAILHADIDIRVRAVRYFADSISSDPTIMPLVIKAVETYGRENDAYRLIGVSKDLRQTEDTITWLIEELNDEGCDKFENYSFNLSRVLVAADPVLLLPRESEILEARHFRPDLLRLITERLQMLSWDEATCWEKLEAFCEEGKDKQYTNEVDLRYAKRIVEALARYGEECEAKVRDLLTIKVDFFNGNPMMWMEPLAVRLAGQIGMESAIPLIIAKLREDGGDILNEECVEALKHIGTPAVLNAISEAFLNAEEYFCIYASGVVEHIHTDLAVETCLRLIEREETEEFRRELIHALLCQFASEGIEIARRWLMGRKLDFMGNELRNYLVETCTLTGDRFPEYEEWKATEQAEKAAHRMRVKEFEGDPLGLLLQFAVDKLTGKPVAEPPKPKVKNPFLPSFRPLPPSKLEPKQRVGRNDPCPCKSGKKFKNCCMK